MIQLPAQTSIKQSKAVLRHLHSHVHDRMAISTQNGLVIVRFADLLYCEAMSNYCKLHLKDGTSVLASKPLKSINSFLPAREFVRVHQSYVVRFDAILTASRNVTLSGGAEIPVSRSRYNYLMNYLRARLPII